ncbi:CDP-alcohol phosphatidyltransferase family protein [Archangium lansingense]|uniref:CDP-diacylglycerol--glycerol-3-phosphate 3-phosphatidyltransferase n=1 Tax=Archangium lansingense TaxID=2995310 RepID=A0ABT4AP04_9BACT|nr:CDP-alcohol phosphatidyltransferase family protein [Archangium lansinium]MCY1082537.1 CDP-alcohol phosphatidyltransferase family protein [Archangium lansinium]
MRRRTSLVLLNALSLCRLPLAVFFVLMEDSLARVGLVLAAALTDFLDGWIARHRHLESYWGALIDPLADRAFVMVALVTFVVEGKLTPVEFGILVVRDVATALGFLVARIVPSFRLVKFQARMLGKVVTTLQLGALLAVLVAPVLVRPLVVAVGVTALAAVADYTATVWRKRTRRQGPRGPTLPNIPSPTGRGTG